jgi:hypothetical protein
MTTLDIAPTVARASTAATARETDITRRVISRAALFTTVAFASLFVIMIGFIGFDQSVPQQYAELLQAQRAPGAYRVFSIGDVFVWLGIGTTLVAIGALVARSAPVRAAFIAACGIG